MRFYWSYGSNLVECAVPVGNDSARGMRNGRYRFTFYACPLPASLTAATLAQLARIRFYAARCKGTQAPLLITLNDEPLAIVSPERANEHPTLIEIAPNRASLKENANFIEIALESNNSAGCYRLYRFESSYWKRAYVSNARIQEKISPPYLEITLRRTA